MTLGAVMSAEMAEQPARLAALLGQADALAGRLGSWSSRPASPVAPRRSCDRCSWPVPSIIALAGWIYIFQGAC